VEVETKNTVNQIDNMNVKIVNTMLKELKKELNLESFLINYPASAHNFDFLCLYWIKYGKRGGRGDMDRGLLRDIIRDTI
jgi:hypothetical protein